MKIALVHDYLNEAGGAERVLQVLTEMYPEAPIYTAFTKNGTARQMLENRKIVESKWGKILKIGRLYSYLRFLLPLIWKSVDLTDYDLVITSCSGYIARGFRRSKKTRVVAYCHTPPRWLYGYETPTGARNQLWGQVFMWVVGPIIRAFDYSSAQEVDSWIANSREVATRIEKYYRKEAKVIYPPITIKGELEKRKLGDYYLVVARLTGAKGIEKAIEGARKAKVRIKIVGEKISKSINIAEGRGVEYLGRVADKELRELYVGARGVIALATDEDFGMTVVEAMRCGTPVLAFRGGGFKETIKEGENGIFIDSLDREVVAEGISKMEKTKWDRQAITKNAERFGRERFEREMRRVVGI